jgi:molybdenum cofactor cytidylyltransferase
MSYYSFVMNEAKTKQISAILLAAGKSERMGQNKLLMAFDGGTIIGRTLDHLLASRVGEVVVVLGSRAQDIGDAIGERQVVMVLNPNFARGMSTSLITGMGMVSKQARLIMVALGDQPFIGTQTYNKLIDAALASDKGVFVPTFHKKRGNPIIISAGYTADIMRLAGDVGGRDLLEKYPKDVQEVPVSDEGILININTKDEYEKRIAALTHRKKE